MNSMTIIEEFLGNAIFASKNGEPNRISMQIYMYIFIEIRLKRQ